MHLVMENRLFQVLAPAFTVALLFPQLTHAQEESVTVLDLAFDAPTVSPLQTRNLPDGQRVVDGEVLLVLERDTSRTAMFERLNAFGMTVLGSVPRLGVW
jgi:hypothetical protein